MSAIGPQPILPDIRTIWRPSGGNASSLRAAARSPRSRNTARTGMPAASSVSRAMPQETNSSASSSWGMTQMSGVQPPTVGLHV